MLRIAQMLDTLTIGGAQKMQLFLVQNLIPLGIEVTVINLRKNPNLTLVAELENAGANVVTFPFQKFLTPVSFFKLVLFLRKGKYDLLQTYLTYSNIIGPIAGLFSHTPVIASVRNAGGRDDKRTKRRMWFENITIKYIARRITANGFSVAEFVRKRIGEVEIDLIPNAVALFQPVDSEERDAIRRSISSDSADKIIIFSAGRLSEIKGFSFLISAFSEVHKRYPDTVLAIAGEGKEFEKLAEQIHTLGLENDVRLLGFRGDVKKILGCVDIYVNSSLWEGTPVSVLEAMSAELPIVATAVGDSPFLLGSNAGILVPPGQPERLINAIISLITDPEKASRLGRAAEKRVISKYNPDAWRQTLLSIYAKVTPKANYYLELSVSRAGKVQ